jgi:hypothetical protein
MNTELIKSSHIILTYQKKEGTKTSFKKLEGPDSILPERLSFMHYSGKEGKFKAYYEINGTYKKEEKGLYYDMNKRNVHTKIIPIHNKPLLLGWGEIDCRFYIYDLIILYSTNNCSQSFQLHLFRGMAKPEYLEAVCNYLQAYINNKSPE